MVRMHNQVGMTSIIYEHGPVYKLLEKDDLAALVSPSNQVNQVIIG